MPAKSKSAPKSRKADGTEKKRWSSAERKDRGHDPRRRGGQSNASTRRDDRPASNRDDRRPTGERAERPAFNRDDRRPAGERSERPTFSRDDRRPSFNRDDRRPTGERSERPVFNRDDRRPSFNRDDRRPAGERSERPTFSRDDRRPSSNRDDRPRSAAHRLDRSSGLTADATPRTTTPELDSIDTLQEQHVTTTQHTDTPPMAGDFASLGLPPSLVSALTAGGITEPFPIQSATIPDALTGRDVLGRGQTGSGKTLAFGLPMIARLADGKTQHPRGLVLVPTRELAMQVTDVLTPLARTLGLGVVLVAGGMSYTPQIRAFQRGVDIVVATPGRLIDLMDQNAVDLTRVEVIVLDEADHMADLGFMPAVTQILDIIPAGGQRMLFSATLDGAVDRLVRRYLSNPVTHQVNSSQASVTTMAHHLVYVAPHDKATLTAEIAGRGGRTVVFVRTQRGADRVAEQLRDAGVMAGALHGGLTQGARTRILSVFKEGELPVLVATDVAARGIHVDEVGLVLQVDPPAGPKEYLHRAGRTARAGGTGVVVTLALPHQRREMTRLTSQAGVKPESLTGQPGDSALAAVTGAVVPSGVAVSTADYERLIAPPRSNRRPSGDRGSRGPRSRSGGYEGRRPQRRSFER
jgi:superfamily II DNA/RNA helicase